MQAERVVALIRVLAGEVSSWHTLEAKPRRFPGGLGGWWERKSGP